MLPVPNSVRFISGSYEGLIFQRGNGPAQRAMIQGRPRVINSTNFWYCDDQALTLDYLRDNKRHWVENSAKDF